ncbi:hypothetical protein [Sporosalibacterium faouarense]|uniref:hypothetical protein n=1 Tax=Sporosalibacterium faouarense TaxID=516123 RepID=UPI00141D4197|nr:hypothetical protein [Sporosalibacterium faouarense]MTI46311.1 hypothetical protein [Bacillota bacterium]
MKKISIVVALLLLLSMLAGCGGSSVTNVEKKNDSNNEMASDTTGEETQNEGEEEAGKDKTEEPKVYQIGDKVTVDDKYALTILGAHTTEERNQFSDKEVAQVVIIDYMYENIAEESEDIYISDMDFKFIDEYGNMCDTYPVGGVYQPENTPVGARSLTSMTIGTIEESDKIKLNYYGNMFSSDPTIEFEVKIGEAVEPVLEGEAPSYENTFSIGDTIEVKTEAGDYTLSIDNIELVTDRNQFAEKDAKEVYKITYTYSNVSLEEDLYISETDFRVIDGNGNMAFTYPGNITKYPQATIKGAKTTAEMIIGTHTEGDTLTLCYSDNMFSSVSDFKIVLENIKGN